ncbi:hypothetical protein Tco_0902176 [Tanacetum coccineum]
MLDYGFNFMNTKIYIDNESTICIVKNPVYHSKTKHIAIRHHFIRDAYEKKLIQVLKIHTNDNVADLLTKAFDVATRPRHCAVPNRKPKDKPHFNEGAKRLFIKKQHHRESWLLFKSKKIAQVVRAWIQSKNTLVKHFEDMRLCRPSKECLQVKLVSMVDDERRSRRFRESLRRVTDGAEAFLILTLFILCLDKVSTDHAKLVPLGKVCTAQVSLEKNTAKGTKCKLEPLISLTDDLSLLSNMAALESCPKHNMIAYLEKTEGNVEFHEVIDFLRRSYIYHALTVSPIVSTTFVEQFWTSAKSKTINNVRHITAKVAGKFVSISEASIRTDLIFDDADGIDSLPNQAIFDAIQLMGYEGDLTTDLISLLTLVEGTLRAADDIPRPFTHYYYFDSIPEKFLGGESWRSQRSRSKIKLSSNTIEACEMEKRIEAMIDKKELPQGNKGLQKELIIWKQRMLRMKGGQEKWRELKDKEIGGTNLVLKMYLVLLRMELVTGMEKVSTEEQVESILEKKALEEEIVLQANQHPLKHPLLQYLVMMKNNSKVLLNTTEKKFKQLESDEEMARKIQEEWEAEEERNRIAKKKMP